MASKSGVLGLPACVDDALGGVLARSAPAIVLPGASPARRKDCVLFVVRVSLRAVRAFALHLARVAAANVLVLTDKLKVRRVEARAVAAQVVELPTAPRWQVWVDGAIRFSVDALLRVSKDAVARAIKYAMPRPACRFSVSFESSLHLIGYDDFSHAISIMPVVVAIKPRIGEFGGLYAVS